MGGDGGCCHRVHVVGREGTELSKVQGCHMNIFFSKIGHLVNLADWAVVERDCLCGDGGVGGLQLWAGELQAGRVLPHSDSKALQIFIL